MAEKLNKKIIIGLILFIIVGLIIYLMRDYLPPRTAIKVARINSDLNIPESCSIIKFKENYSFTGEGQIEIKLKINDLDIEKLKKECVNLNYKKLTIENLIDDKFLDLNPDLGLKIPNVNLRKISNGFYKLKIVDRKKLDVSISVLDLDNNELIIWILIP